jgi:hypothetical protein
MLRSFSNPGHAATHAASRRLLSSVSCLERVVEGRVFSEIFSFPCQLSLNHMLHLSRLSFAGGTAGHLRSKYQGNSHPTPRILKSNQLLDQNPFWCADNRCADREIPAFYGTLADKSRLLGPTTSYFNPFHDPELYLRSSLMLSFHLYLGLQSGLFPLSPGFLIISLYSFRVSSLRGACPAHLFLLDWIVLLMFGGRGKWWNSFHAQSQIFGASIKFPESVLTSVRTHGTTWGLLFIEFGIGELYGKRSKHFNFRSPVWY